MHGHDTHLIRALLHVAADLAACIAQPGKKALKASGSGLLIGQRQIEELVDRVRCFRPEPGNQPRARTVSVQHARVELEGPQAQGLLPPARQPRLRRRKTRRIPRRLFQRFPQAVLAFMRQRKEVVFRKPDERAFQHGRKRQIVAGQQQRIAQRQQVHDCELVGQAHSVRPGHGYAPAFQRVNHRRGEGLALAHENEDIARADRAALGM